MTDAHPAGPEPTAHDPTAPGPAPADRTVHDLELAGAQVRRAVLGDVHVDRAVATATAFNAPWQEYVTRAAWGEVWTRPGLDRRTRSLVTVALLTAMGYEDELAMHVAGALRNGVTPVELQEVLLHTAVYAGAPAANSAFTVAQRVLVDLGVPEAVARPSGSEGAEHDGG